MMFGDFMNPDAAPEERVYQEVMSLDEMYSVVHQCLEEYNNTHKNRMNLVIFRSAMCLRLSFNIDVLKFVCVGMREIEASAF